MHGHAAITYALIMLRHSQVVVYSPTLQHQENSKWTAGLGISCNNKLLCSGGTTYVGVCFLNDIEPTGPKTQGSAYIVALVPPHIKTDNNKILKTVGILENNIQVKTARCIVTYRFSLGLTHTHTHIH